MGERTILVTVSDDRSGRKEGKYSETQDRVKSIFSSNEWFGITDFSFWKWNDIIHTDFYKSNRKILDQFDPAMNGRCYKPFAILEGLKLIEEGDFLIYNDVSPEWWVNIDGINPSEFNLDVIKNLCSKNKGILTADVTWFTDWGIGDHTHENFTLERCINRMGMQEYKYSLQHASGMMVLQKNERTVDFVNEWLYWNLIDECASLGSSGSEPVFPDKCICEYWHDEVEKYGKIGHRHDQSISGLILNKMGHKLIKNRGRYNFLEFCRIGFNYEFIDSNPKMSNYVYRTVFDGNSWGYTRTERT